MGAWPRRRGECLARISPILDLSTANMRVLWIFTIFLIFWAHAQQVTAPERCHKDIDDDICPQREGKDPDCEARCKRAYPMSTDSFCYLRSTGTLLSFFGIRSFVCRCELRGIACSVSNGPIADLQPFSSILLPQYANTKPIRSDGTSCGKTAQSSCRDHFDADHCDWKMSDEFQWFQAHSNGAPSPITAVQQPEGPFLAGWSSSGATWASIASCDSLCSVSNVNVSLRIWKPAGVLAELEKESTMCSPIKSENGLLMSEIIPEAANFQIVVRFSNVSSGELILLDDLHLGYDACPITTTTVTPTTAKFTTPLPSVSTLSTKNQREELKRRYCQGADCELATTQSLSPHRTCIGRNGLTICRLKCSALDPAQAHTLSPRCVRQKDKPFQKRCICSLRRSPELAIKKDFAEKPKELLKKEEPRVEKCAKTSCSFDDETCRWSDLRLLSLHFNNISIAVKKDDENRYAITKLRPFTYSGLLYSEPLVGPIDLSIDVFASHTVDLRVCVQNLRKCQTQEISARNWNRVNAHIKVHKTDKLFIIIHNREEVQKSVAMDNVVIKTGNC